MTVLAAVGFVSLRQDRLLAKKDAEEKAQAIASELLVRAWQNLTASNHEDHAFRADKQGNLIFPPLVAELPSPKPFRLTDLTPEQLHLWNSLRNPPIRGSEEDADIQTYRAFLIPIRQRISKASPNTTSALSWRQGESRKQPRKHFQTLLNVTRPVLATAAFLSNPLAQLKILEVTSFGVGYYDMTKHSRVSRPRIRPRNSVSPR